MALYPFIFHGKVGVGVEVLVVGGRLIILVGGGFVTLVVGGGLVTLFKVGAVTEGVGIAVERMQPNSKDTMTTRASNVTESLFVRGFIYPFSP